MTERVVPYLLLCLVYFCDCKNWTDAMIQEEKHMFLIHNEQLFHDVFGDYVPSIPPVFTKRCSNLTCKENATVVTDTIQVVLQQAKIVDVDPMKQLMTLFFTYALIWFDPRIQWEPENYHNISMLTVPRKRVWIPDVTPFDSTVVTDTRSKRNQWAKITYYGLCYFVQSTVTSINCVMDVSNFPFDSHNCSVKLLSYSISIEEAQLNAQLSPQVNATTATNAEWDVTNITSQNGIIFPDESPTQQRNFNFYMMMIILPSFILTFTCMAGFFTSNLEIDDSVKYEMGLTTIMSMTVMIGIVSELIPKTQYIPKLTLYVCLNLFYLLLATTVVIYAPKFWQFISLMFTSCKNRKRGWFRRHFWFFRGVFTFLCLIFFEWMVFNNLASFLGDTSILVILPAHLMFIHILLCFFPCEGDNLTDAISLLTGDATRKHFVKENQRLYHHLFDKYNRDLPPVYTIRDNVNLTDIIKPESYDVPRSKIHITLVYAKLLSVDSARGLMTLIFEYTMTWEDQRLVWNPTEYNGIEHLYVNRKRIWVPELTPQDSMEVTDTRPEYKQLVKVSFFGLAEFYTSSVVTANCEMDVNDFPFDIQNCSIRLLSYTYNVAEIELESYVFKTVNSKDTGNEEWEVLNVTSESQILDEAINPVQVNQFTFRMKRNASYYTVLIIMPSFILTFLCIAGLFTSPMKADDIDKIAMGLTTIMSSVVMISVLSQSIPKTKSTNYITINLFVVSFAIAVSILVPKIGQLLFLFGKCIRRCYRKIRKLPKPEKRSDLSCCQRYSWLFKGIFTAIILVIFETMAIVNLALLLINENTKDAFGIKK